MGSFDAVKSVTPFLNLAPQLLKYAHTQIEGEEIVGLAGYCRRRRSLQG